MQKPARKQGRNTQPSCVSPLLTRGLLQSLFSQKDLREIVRAILSDSDADGRFQPVGIEQIVPVRRRIEPKLNGSFYRIVISAVEGNIFADRLPAHETGVVSPVAD